MSYNEQRVRTAFDELVFQWADDGCVGEDYDHFLEVLHDGVGGDIYDVIENCLSDELLVEMENGDYDELRRRLRNQYPREGEVEDEEGNYMGRVRVLDPDEGCECEVCEIARRPHGDFTSDASETPAQFEARRARLWRAFEGVLSPRDIRALVWNTRR
jgi:hypothetical protein